MVNSRSAFPSMTLSIALTKSTCGVVAGLSALSLRTCSLDLLIASLTI